MAGLVRPPRVSVKFFKHHLWVATVVKRRDLREVMNYMIGIRASGTRKEELLCLTPTNTIALMELMLNKLKKSCNNVEFLLDMGMG